MSFRRAFRLGLEVDGMQLSPELEEKLRQLDGNDAKAASFQVLRSF